MTTILKKIEKEIKNSDLSKEEQGELLVFLSFLSDEEIEPIRELFSNDKSWILEIYKNIKSKYLALVSKNQNLWEKIVKEEVDLLKKIDN